MCTDRARVYSLSPTAVWWMKCLFHCRCALQTSTGFEWHSLHAGDRLLTAQFRRGHCIYLSIDAVNGTDYAAVNDSRTGISEWERMWKEPAVVCQSSQHLPGRREGAVQQMRIWRYSDTLESGLNQFQNPVRVPRQFSPFKIIETGLIRSWVPRTRIFKIILTVNTLDFKVKY